MQVEYWNHARNNTTFDKELEIRMLAEEAQEFKDGLNMYLKAFHNTTASVDAIVEMVDAWADYQFVLQGTLYKYLGSDVPFDFYSIKTQEKYMYSVLTEYLVIEPNTLSECLQAVIRANNAKSTEKVGGKIQKGEAWRDPKELILKILVRTHDV